MTESTAAEGPSDAANPFDTIRRIPRSDPTVGKLTFDVATAGPDDGEPVLLLHGFPQSYDAWQPITPLLTAAGLRVIAPDQRGYSPDARPDGVEAYTIEHLVDDVIGILDAYDVTQAHVVGHDWGASVAWALAAHHPDRVATLTAVSVPHLAAFGHALATDPDQRSRSRYISAFREPGRAEEALLADDGRRFRAMFAGHVPEALVDAHWRRHGSGGGLTATLNWYRAMTPAMSDLPAVTVPTTFVWSNGDDFLGRTGAEACGGYVTADYRFTELDDVSHWIPEEAPEQLARQVIDRAQG